MTTTIITIKTITRREQTNALVYILISVLEALRSAVEEITRTNKQGGAPERHFEEEVIARTVGILQEPTEESYLYRSKEGEAGQAAIEHRYSSPAVALETSAYQQLHQPIPEEVEIATDVWSLEARSEVRIHYREAISIPTHQHQQSVDIGE